MCRRVRPAHPRDREPFFGPEQAASSTECTGLLPAQVETDDEAENLAALQGIHRIQSTEHEKKKR